MRTGSLRARRSHWVKGDDTPNLEKMCTNNGLEAHRKKRRRLSKLSGSLGDTRSLMCSSTWLSERVYRGKRIDEERKDALGKFADWKRRFETEVSTGSSMT